MRLLKVQLLVLLLVIFVSETIYGQEIKIQKIDREITVDGILNEEVWNTVEPLSGFTQFEPKYGEASSQVTRVKILYSDKNIYFAFECEDNDITIISNKITRRDSYLGEDDAVGVFLDTFNDENNAYGFSINSNGTQQDIRITDNGRTSDGSWDAYWSSAASVNERGWTAEISIPFESLTFNKQSTAWGFNAFRTIPRNLEQSYLAGNLTQTSKVSEFLKITGLDLLDVNTKNYVFIPYYQAQKEKGDKPAGDAGFDLKYNFSNNINADATYNPDFATIEADVDRINLTRFELSYPEKRTFFLEGSENFRSRIRQFYSRRIGEIPFGAKLNGKSGAWNLNFLHAISDPSSVDTGLSPGKDAQYTVFNVGREVINSSSIRIIGANRGFKNSNQGSIGINSTLFFSDYLGMTSQVIKSYGDYSKGTWAYFFRPSFDSQTGHFHVRYTNLGEHFRENVNDIGFIQDDDRKEFDTNATKTFWINKTGLEYIRVSENYNRYYNQKGNLRSWNNNAELEFKLYKNWELIIENSSEFKRYEIDFRDQLTEFELNFDNHKGNYYEVGYGFGREENNDTEQIHGEISMKVMEGLNIEYNVTKAWFRPRIDRNTLIHFLRTTYYMNTDMYFKLFYRSRYHISGEYFNTDLDLNNESLQLVYVWRFLPPFGSFQCAYQRGKLRVGEKDSGMSSTFFLKTSWVF